MKVLYPFAVVAAVAVTSVKSAPFPKLHFTATVDEIEERFPRGGLLEGILGGGLEGGLFGVLINPLVNAAGEV